MNSNKDSCSTDELNSQQMSTAPTTNPSEIDSKLVTEKEEVGEKMSCSLAECGCYWEHGKQTKWCLNHKSYLKKKEEVG